MGCQEKTMTFLFPKCLGSCLCNGNGGVQTQFAAEGGLGNVRKENLPAVVSATGKLFFPSYKNVVVISA